MAFWLAELAPLNDPQLVTSIIADALGVSLGAPQAAVKTLTSTLEHKQLLLIIDNCEHVITEVARVAEALMRKCAAYPSWPRARAVGDPSRIRHPCSIVVGPRGWARTDANKRTRVRGRATVRERANALGQDFALTSSNVEAVAAICRRLDGIPLAIELAVPRLRVMSVQQLERALDQRFRILTVGSRTALARQQTLHALFEWSYDLLTEAEKLLLSRVSIFSGGASVASIIAVTSEYRDSSRTHT